MATIPFYIANYFVNLSVYNCSGADCEKYLALLDFLDAEYMLILWILIVLFVLSLLRWLKYRKSA